MVVQPILLRRGSSNAEQYGLLVALCSRLSQPVDRLVLEMRTQDIPALIDAIERYHHREYAAGLEPAKELIQKQFFHPLILTFADLKIVGRVQIQQGERLHGCLGVESIALNHFI